VTSASASGYTPTGAPLGQIFDRCSLFDAADSDIDYFYTSRLPGEPLGGIDDIHTHPTLPRSARVNLVVGS
jgi:hypothetical protein